MHIFRVRPRSERERENAIISSEFVAPKVPCTQYNKLSIRAQAVKSVRVCVCKQGVCMRARAHSFFYTVRLCVHENERARFH